MNEACIERNVKKNMADLKKRLTLLRRESKITQDILADELKVPRSTIAAWELGVRKPKAAQLWQLAEYYGVTVDYLLGFADERYKNAVTEPILS